MKKNLLFYLLLLPLAYTNTMKLNQLIPVPEGVPEVFSENIKSLNENIQSLNLSKEEIDSLKSVVSEFNKKFIMHWKHEFDIEKKNVHYYIFCQWLFQENVRSYFEDKTKLEPIASSGYCFFGGNMQFNIEKIYLDATKWKTKCRINQYKGFNGKQWSITDNTFFQYKNTSDPTLKKVLRASMCSQYKIHLMPTKETLYKTVYKLFLTIRENPAITDNINLRDLIHDFKVLLNPGEMHNNQPLPTIVLYIPTIFGEKKNFTAPDFFDKFDQYVDYKKSKYCLELLLTFLIDFFEEHSECKGSGTTPRFNNRVNDMIFFSHGNGDDKINSYQDFFEDGFPYFKSQDENEDFKVDVPKLLREKLPLQKPKKFVDSVRQNQPYTQKKINLIDQSQSSGQSSASNETEKSTSENSDSSWSSIKNFFYTIFSSLIAFIIGPFLFF